MLADSTRPSRRSASQRDASITSSKKRCMKLTCRSTPQRSPSATIRSAAATLPAIGFCTSAALPARAAATAIASCVSSGVATITASTSLRSMAAPTSSVASGMPKRSARARVFSSERPAMTRTSAPPAAARPARWYSAMAPAPSIATPVRALRIASGFEAPRRRHQRRIERRDRLGVRVLERVLRRLEPARGDQVLGQPFHVAHVALVERRIERVLIPDRVGERAVLLGLLHEQRDHLVAVLRIGDVALRAQHHLHHAIGCDRALAHELLTGHEQRPRVRDLRGLALVRREARLETGVHEIGGAALERVVAPRLPAQHRLDRVGV